MSKVLAARDQEPHVQTDKNVLDRLIPTWQPVPVTQLRTDALYLFVTPSQRLFGTYQGRQNGDVHVKMHRGEPAKSVETSHLEAYKIGGDVSVAEELNRRFGIPD